MASLFAYDMQEFGRLLGTGPDGWISSLGTAVQRVNNSPFGNERISALADLRLRLNRLYYVILVNRAGVLPRIGQAAWDNVNVAFNTAMKTYFETEPLRKEHILDHDDGVHEATSRIRFARLAVEEQLKANPNSPDTLSKGLTLERWMQMGAWYLVGPGDEALRAVPAQPPGSKLYYLFVEYRKASDAVTKVEKLLQAASAPAPAPASPQSSGGAATVSLTFMLPQQAPRQDLPPAEEQPSPFPLGLMVAGAALVAFLLLRRK